MGDASSGARSRSRVPITTVGIVLLVLVIFGLLLLSCSFVGPGCERYLNNVLKFLSIVARAVG